MHLVETLLVSLIAEFFGGLLVYLVAKAIEKKEQ